MSSNIPLNSKVVVMVILTSDKMPLCIPFSEKDRGGFTFNDEIFENSNFGEWLGFYDWLRDKDERVIGVRLYFGEKTIYFPFNRPFFNVEIDLIKLLLHAFFTDNKSIDEAKSEDQDFGENSLYLGKNGSIGISFHGPS